MKIGPFYLGEQKCEFRVWAPFSKEVSLKIISPESRKVPMHPAPRGYWKVEEKGVSPGTRYLYSLEGRKDRPDPASPFQPEGVHRPSQVVDHGRFRWNDQEWQGISLEKMVIYEIHVGTFTPQGTFEGLLPRLRSLKDLGINTLSLMPVAQFPGHRNWGYDGAYPFAVQNSYGGPQGLKKLVDGCHGEGIAVILDVVYNHLGPEGNYLRDFGPYFTDKYRTPWGEAVNFDGAHSDEVRNFFLQNALHWFQNYHMDGLRLDAVHGIYDRNARPFLQQLGEEVEIFSGKEGRKFYLIAESDLNDTRILYPRSQKGFGLDSQWCDDFHHALHALLTGERTGYYVDFGKVGHLAKSLKEGYVLSGQYSQYRLRNHGISSRNLPAEQFVVFSQNHDQVGNRMKGERLTGLVSFEALKTAAGAVIFSPYIPLLFMGEEYAEESPFLYFVHHSDQDLVEAVRLGRMREFQAFGWRKKPPLPQDESTFTRSRLRWNQRNKGKHRVMLRFYRRVLELREKIPALAYLSKNNMEVNHWKKKKALAVHRWHRKNHVFLIFNFSEEEQILPFPFFERQGKKGLDSSEKQWLGPGSYLSPRSPKDKKLKVQPLSFCLYQKED